MAKLIVTEAQIIQAMQFFEKRAGPRDGITLCKENSKLADLLGVMWHHKESRAAIAGDSTICALLSEAGIQLAEGATEAHLHTESAVDHAAIGDGYSSDVPSGI